MRKGKKIVLAGLTMAAAACLAAGCAAAKGYQFEYEKYVPQDKLDYTLDEGVVIDGNADESFWEGLKPISFTDPESDVSMTTWAYIGENGLYLYAESTDKSVFFSTEKEFYQNDEMEFMIDPRPEYSRSEEGMTLAQPVRTDCLQIRVDSQGRNQKYYGRKVGQDYPWATGWYSVETAAVVNGTINETNGAQGYSVEAFVAWDAMMLDEKPEEVAVCPAFNNTDTASDTGRKWFTYKGMSHAIPSSYALVDASGFQIIADDFELSDPLDLNADDYADATVADIYEVTQENTSPALRGEIRAKLGEDGAYFYATVHDKALTRYSSNIWNNDGVELYLDLNGAGGNSQYREGILRVGVDIDGGYATFTQRTTSTGVQQSVCSHRKMFVVTNISDYAGGENEFDYRYTYHYEFMIPYEALGYTEQPDRISFGWAIKTPNELAYTQDRMLNGEMNASNWLYAYGHHPHTPSQYYRVYKDVSSIQLEVDDMQGVVGYYTAVFPRFAEGIPAEEVTYSVADTDSEKVIVDGNKLYAKEKGLYEITASTASGAQAKFTLNVIGMDDSVVATRPNFSLNEFKDRARFVVARQESLGFDDEGLTIFLGDSFTDDGLFFTNFYSLFGDKNANISGISASLAAQWIYYAQDILYPYEPDQVVVHLGTNDIGGQTAPEVIKTLTYMFDSFHDALPETTFWWWTIEQHLDWAGNYKGVAVNEAMREYAEGKDWLKIVDSYTAVSNSDGTPNRELYRDSVHLTLEGYAKVLGVMDDMGFTVVSRTTPLVSFDGEGTEENPFKIGTAEELLRFSVAVTSKLSYLQGDAAKMYASAYYMLTQDIDLAGIEFPSIGRCTSRAHATDTDVAFTGTFDGNEKTISNLTVESADGSLGLFGHVVGANIFDLTIESASIKAGGMRAAVLVSRAQSATITNVTVSGLVEGTESVGGIVGIIVGGTSVITNCKNYATIKGTLYGAGGIVGDNLNAGFTIQGCENYGAVYGQQAGGMIGMMRVASEIVVENCLNYADINGTEAAGGIAGTNEGTLRNSFCLETAIITLGEQNVAANILYAFGMAESIGSIAGMNNGEVVSCGTIDDKGTQTPAVAIQIENSGCTVKLVKIEGNQVTFEVTADEGYTFAGAFLNGTALSGMTFTLPQENAVLTVICNMSFGGGNGTQQDPFIISTSEHLRALSAAINGAETFLSGEEQIAYAKAYYILGSDIDLGGEQFAPIGNVQANAFGGTFDGNDHKISNLSVTSVGGTIGLFGNTIGATIRDLTIENAVIKAGGMRAAVLVARAQATTITNVTVSGSVEGTESLGGIVGIIAGEASIINDCKNYATIQGTLYGSGGIVGDNVNAGFFIENCENHGTVIGQYAGGIIGLQRDSSEMKIVGCINYANVSGIQEAGGIAGRNIGTIEDSDCLTAAIITLGENTVSANALSESGTAEAYLGYLVGNNTGSITGSGLCDENGQPVVVKITLHLDPGSGLLPDGETGLVEVTHGTAVGELPVPARTGFRFDGWYDGETLVTEETIYYAPERTVTLTAKWVEQVTVTFDAGEGTINGKDTTVSISIDKGTVISDLPVATRAEYAFLGWYDGETLITTQTQFDVSKTLLAHWESRPTYTVITFDVGGGTYVNEAQETQLTLAVGDELGGLPEATRNGYRLLGWFAADGSQVNEESTFSVSAVTLTARWQKVTVVTFVAPYGATMTETTRLVDEGSALGEFPSITLLKGNVLLGWFTAEGEAVTTETVFTEDAVTLSARDGWDGITASDSFEGDGTQENPYKIASGADLYFLASETNYGTSFADKYFLVVTDIDLNQKTFARIGNSTDNAFHGTFDGGGHTILNLSFTSGSSIGLFGNATDATIRNLTIRNASIKANGMRAAVLVARAQSVRIEDVVVYGTVEGTESVGGIVGIVAGAETSCTIIGCKNYAVLKGSLYGIGGIVGDTLSAGVTIENCENYGTINGSQAGGIIGLVRQDGQKSITDCRNFAAVSGTQQAGGIVGDTVGTGITIENCDNSGNITSTGNSVGGIVSLVRGTVMITGCTNSGIVTATVASGATARAGGIVGGVGETGSVSIDTCENSGSVTAAGAWYVGGIVGFGGNAGTLYASITIRNCVNRGEISSAERVGGIVGGSANAQVVITVENSTNYGKVIASNNVSFVGGVFGIFRKGGNQTIDEFSTTKTETEAEASEGLIFKNTTTDVTASAVKYGGSV